MIVLYEAQTLQSDCRVLVDTNTCTTLALHVSNTSKLCHIIKIINSYVRNVSNTVSTLN